MAENADDILKEIKARKQAKKEGIEIKEGGEVAAPIVEIKNISENIDLKEIALRIEGKK
jgi:hypothetical protein